MGDRGLPSRDEAVARAAASQSTHKPRSHWFQARAAWPWREASGDHLARQRKEKCLRDNKYAWISLGPTNVGGRLTSMVGDPQDANRLWVGAAGGGVWRTDDAGRTWTSQWHDEETLNIGALAMDPQDPKTLYCGTGEANLSGDSYPGVGLYTTNDGGGSWSRLEDPSNPDHKRLPRRIGALAVHPQDRNRLLLGGVAFDWDHPPQGSVDRPLGGLWASNDRGMNWRRLDLGTFGDAPYWCHAVVFDPKDPDQIYVTLTERGARSGIWCSRDGGARWEHLRNGLPEPERFHRTSLAVAPSRPESIYALAADRYRKVLGVFRSDNEGRTWRDVSAASFRSERGMTYNNTIAVHPRDPDYVVWGGVDLHRSLDGGVAWEQITSFELPPGHPAEVHADHHAILFPPTAEEEAWVFSANDGGLAVSESWGDRWASRSTGLVTTLFYDVAISPKSSRHYGGGTQDNGTLVNSLDREDAFFQAVVGDGGWVAYDLDDPERLWATVFPRLEVYRKRWALTESVFVDDGLTALAGVPLAIDPRDRNHLLTATDVIISSWDGGETWEKSEQSFDGSAVTAIEFARSDPKRCYAGTEDGAFVRSSDGGATWSDNLAGATLPGRTVTRIRSDPKRSEHVIITVGGQGNRHVFLTTDAGTSWQDIDQGQLPSVPHQAVEILQSGRIVVANDAGIFSSSDQGKTWECLNGDLPNVMMTDVVFDDKGKRLLIATHGRGLWALALP